MAIIASYSIYPNGALAVLRTTTLHYELIHVSNIYSGNVDRKELN